MADNRLILALLDHERIRVSPQLTVCSSSGHSHTQNLHGFYPRVGFIVDQSRHDTKLKPLEYNKNLRFDLTQKLRELIKVSNYRC